MNRIFILPKLRAQVSLRAGLAKEYAITDSVTRERIECDSEAHMWQVFAEVQARGLPA